MPSHTDQHGASDLTCAPRNYLQGKLQFEEPAAGESQLQTLIASSNYLTCEEPGLDNAALLGQGRFQGVLYSSLLQIQSGGWMDYANSQQFQSLGGTGVYATAVIFAFDPSEIAHAVPSVDNVVLVFTGHHQSLRIVLVIDGSTL